MGGRSEGDEETGREDGGDGEGGEKSGRQRKVNESVKRKKTENISKMIICLYLPPPFSARAARAPVVRAPSHA
jgi:hypothetical protein